MSLLIPLYDVLAHYIRVSHRKCIDELSSESFQFSNMFSCSHDPHFYDRFYSANPSISSESLLMKVGESVGSGI